jgi:predicted ABC-type sugar transport system permease subunit
LACSVFFLPLKNEVFWLALVAVVVVPFCYYLLEKQLLFSHNIPEKILPY